MSEAAKNPAVVELKRIRMGLLALGATGHIVAGVAVIAASRGTGVEMAPVGMLFVAVGVVQKFIAAWQWITQTDHS